MPHRSGPSPQRGRDGVASTRRLFLRDNSVSESQSWWFSGHCHDGGSDSRQTKVPRRGSCASTDPGDDSVVLITSLLQCVAAVTGGDDLGVSVRECFFRGVGRAAADRRHAQSGSKTRPESAALCWCVPADVSEMTRRSPEMVETALGKKKTPPVRFSVVLRGIYFVGKKVLAVLLYTTKSIPYHTTWARESMTTCPPSRRCLFLVSIRLAE